MDTETAKEQELFDAALPIGSPEERNAFLDRACDGDPDLRTRVSKLWLAYTIKVTQFFQECLPDFAAAWRMRLRRVADGDSPEKLSEGPGLTRGRTLQIAQAIGGGRLWCGLPGRTGRTRPGVAWPSK